jgi:hypothetical protein
MRNHLRGRLVTNLTRSLLMIVMVTVVYSQRSAIEVLFGQIAADMSFWTIVLSALAFVGTVWLGGPAAVVRLCLMALILLFSIALNQFFAETYGPTPLAQTVAFAIALAVYVCFTPLPDRRQAEKSEEPTETSGESPKTSTPQAS